jgi:hypothetical protein
MALLPFIYTGATRDVGFATALPPCGSQFPQSVFEKAMLRFRYGAEFGSGLGCKLPNVTRLI